MTSSLENAFKEAEASLWLEGMDLAGDAYYQKLKSRVLSGELTFDDARRQIREHYARSPGSSA